MPRHAVQPEWDPPRWRIRGRRPVAGSRQLLQYQPGWRQPNGNRQGLGRVMGDFVVNCYTRQDLSYPALWNHGDARRLLINMTAFVRGAAATALILLIAGCGQSTPKIAPQSSVT